MMLRRYPGCTFFGCTNRPCIVDVVFKGSVWVNREEDVVEYYREASMILVEGIFGNNAIVYYICVVYVVITK